MGWSVPRRLLQIMRFGWSYDMSASQQAINCLPITFQKQAAFPLIIQLWRNQDDGDFVPKVES